MYKAPKIIYQLTLLLFIVFSSVSAQFHKEIVHFESANPFSLSDIIIALDKQEKQNVFGQLTIPTDSLNHNKKYPLIIGVAGSMGWREHHLDYIKMYQEQGFATFELNSFKSRGITSTVGSQDEVTVAAVILDAYRALETLAQHSNIDKDKVAITGWSLGGGVALFSGWLPLKNVITTKLSFAAHLAFYPPCFINPENLSFTKAPMHILIGEDDNWTPASPCEDLVNTLSKNTNIGITVYPDSHHGFDSKEPVSRNEKGYSFKDCLFDLTAEGDVLMNYLRLPMSNPTLQKVGFLFCVERGVDIGGNPEARKKSLAFAKSFMERELLTP
ncbi:MAG: dienelactone hydrolase family protein [Flavobacteriaceae bacterium]|nr:dienelactone hydrolase family protein [Flavobacteriaceae bacterium]